LTLLVQTEITKVSIFLMSVATANYTHMIFMNSPYMQIILLNHSGVS